MNFCKLTEFGLCVKTELLKRGKPQRWLEEAVTDKILTGQRKAPKIVNAICEILDLPDASTS